LDLSVLIASKGAGRLLSQAIRSCLSDLNRGDHVIVGITQPEADDWLAITQVRDDRVSFVLFGDSPKLSEARNRLLETARTELVANLDADDISLPMRFKLSRKIISLGLGDLVFGSAVTFNVVSRKVGFQAPFYLGAKASRLALLLQNPFPHSTMCGKREVIMDAGGYPPGMSEDYKLWIRLSVQGRRLIRVPFWFAIYRVHPNQVSKSAAMILQSSDVPVFLSDLMVSLKITLGPLLERSLHRIKNRRLLKRERVDLD
jgi:hypothetical protein